MNFIEPKNFFYDFRKEIRYFLAQYPKTFFITQKYLYGFVDQSRMINPNTQIAIEGFPCSANSFAHTAFKLAQNIELLLYGYTNNCFFVLANYAKAEYFYLQGKNIGRVNVNENRKLNLNIDLDRLKAICQIANL